MIGVVDLATAMKKAADAGLDLVEISPQADPPVCKILDFGKFKYEAKKKSTQAKKKQRVISIKEIKLRVTIGEHDLQVKMRHIREFIAEGDKVRVSLKFRGREITHNELGLNLMRRIQEEMTEIAKPEMGPKIEGSQVVMTLVTRAQ